MTCHWRHRVHAQALGRPARNAAPRARRPAPTQNLLRRGARSGRRSCLAGPCLTAGVGRRTARACVPRRISKGEIDVCHCRVARLSRISPRRELKIALGCHWSGKSDRGALLAVAADLRTKTSQPGWRIRSKRSDMARQLVAPTACGGQRSFSSTGGPATCGPCSSRFAIQSWRARYGTWALMPRTSLPCPRPPRSGDLILIFTAAWAGIPLPSRSNAMAGVKGAHFRKRLLDRQSLGADFRNRCGECSFPPSGSHPISRCSSFFPRHGGSPRLRP